VAEVAVRLEARWSAERRERIRVGLRATFLEAPEVGKRPDSMIEDQEVVVPRRGRRGPRRNGAHPRHENTEKCKQYDTHEREGKTTSEVRLRHALPGRAPNSRSAHRGQKSTALPSTSRKARQSRASGELATPHSAETSRVELSGRITYHHAEASEIGVNWLALALGA
jgi:hypothetical protein